MLSAFKVFSSLNFEYWDVPLILKSSRSRLGQVDRGYWQSNFNNGNTTLTIDTLTLRSL